MKHIILLLIGCYLGITNVSAQILEPVKWTTSIEKISDTEYDLIATSKIDAGWHLYSQNVPEDGPIPTSFEFETNENYELVGKVKEEEGHTINDPVFNMRIKFFENNAVFKQRIKVLNEELSIVKGEVEFMVCDDTRCLPPTYIDFNFNLKRAKPSETASNTFQLGGTDSKSQLVEPVKWQTAVEKISDTEYILISTAQIENKWHLYSQEVPENGPIPTTFDYQFGDDAKRIGKTIQDEGITLHDPVFDMEITYFENSAQFKQKIEVSNKDITSLTAEVGFMACNDVQCTAPTYNDLVFDLTKSTKAKSDMVSSSVSDKKEQKGLWTIFLLGIGAGFIALLTPCVFPLIPMTVSFFTKQSKNKAQGIKNAIIYGLCIIVIYVVLGTAVVGVFGASAINEFSTSVTFNLLFFVILVIFAVSFLGAFEIMLPNSWANKIDKKADRGGYTGIFFMALALAIVSFSCTGPFVGNIIVLSASKGGIAPMIGMLGFSLALALPFGLFAAFPGWLNSLPKSGGWLNTVKVVLGFLELAFAFKFLSQADLVLQLHFLEREVFIAIWIAVFGALAFYLFGKIKLPHDSPLTHISVGRLSLGLLVLSFTIYMIPGLWGAPLNLISAFPPPLDYAESPYGVGNSRTGGSAMSTNEMELPEGAHLLAPHQILAFNDYDKGMAYAKSVNKPVMLDFTGWACVNCRKMEQNVWPNDQVLNILKNDIILISLYVDDKRKLPENEVFGSKLRPGKQLKYIGQKWSEFQTIKFKTNTQPFYALVDTDGEVLNEPVGYTPDAKEYYSWMQEGLEAFKE